MVNLTSASEMRFRSHTGNNDAKDFDFYHSNLALKSSSLKIEESQARNCLREREKSRARKRNEIGLNLGDNSSFPNRSEPASFRTVPVFRPGSRFGSVKNL
jgi:hypothetical protein